MITATFTQGLDEVTALGLTQWDYGQKLEIRGLTLPATFQVHFACKRTSEAIIYSATEPEKVEGRIWLKPVTSEG